MSLRLKAAAVICLLFCQVGFSAERVSKVAKPSKGLNSKGMQACAEDIQKWCGDVIPGESRLGGCLYAHFAELSPSCLTFAAHGGPGHEKASLLDIDRNYKPAASNQQKK